MHITYHSRLNHGAQVTEDSIDLPMDHSAVFHTIGLVVALALMMISFAFLG